MRVLWVAAALAGCVQTSTQQCPDGVVCPSGKQCAVVTTTAGARPFCVDAGRLGCTSGERCGDASTCHDGVCFADQCGDYLVDVGEACDDGNNTSGDACSADCVSTEVCGNGVTDVASGEECDSGIAGLSHDGCSSGCKREDVSWRDITPAPISARADIKMVYDSARDRVVQFGGVGSDYVFDETWEWDGATWGLRNLGRSPPGRVLHTLAYDSVRGRTVLFGGFGATLLGDTWEYDGSTWVQMNPTTSPPPLFYAASGYDPARGRVVLHGGQSGSGTNPTPETDTWEWDGTTWTKMATNGPAPDAFMEIAYDAYAGQLVMASAGKTYTWTGSSWAQASGTNPRFEGMAFDQTRNRLVGFVNQTMYVRDGTWSLVVSGGPPTREEFAMAPAASGVIVFGGVDYGAMIGYADTWQLVNTTWTDVSSAPLSPPKRTSHGLAYDQRRGEVVLYGGGSQDPYAPPMGDTWLWSQGTWRRAQLSTNPPPRAELGLVYDAAHDRVVMFGGANHGNCCAAFTPLGDTWTWNGTAWSDATPAGSPPARRSPAMAYDAARGEVVMFGGKTGKDPGQILGDTWIWNGTTWTQRVTPVAPPPREHGGMAFDPIRQRIVLFSGQDGQMAAIGDTWEWDGASWTERQPVSKATPMAYPTMTYDGARQKIVAMFGETWEWDGVTWTKLDVRLVGQRSAMAYDPTTQQQIVFGGISLFGLFGDTLALGYRAATPGERCLLGDADDDSDGLVGCADPDCWGRCSPLCPPGTSCPSTAPRCGDGACGAVEDRALCPQDCL